MITNRSGIGSLPEIYLLPVAERVYQFIASSVFKFLDDLVALIFSEFIKTSSIYCGVNLLKNLWILDAMN